LIDISANIYRQVPSILSTCLILGSKKLAGIILARLTELNPSSKLPRSFPSRNQGHPPPDPKGAIVIAGSCIANGKNLLYVSRVLRQHEGIPLIYFVGLSRTKSEAELNFLTGNLTQGEYGKQSHAYVSVYTFHMTNESRRVPWLYELETLKKVQGFAESIEEFGELVINEIENRILLLQTLMDDTNRGMAHELFFPVHGSQNPLTLRKNFAFFQL
jgi:hypothetical protein